MDPGYSTLGFLVIVILYAVIGLMAAAGVISIIRKILPQSRADLLCDVPHHDRCVGFRGYRRRGAWKQQPSWRLSQ
jgi:hypothetical protein